VGSKNRLKAGVENSCGKLVPAHWFGCGFDDNACAAINRLVGTSKVRALVHPLAFHPRTRLLPCGRIDREDALYYKAVHTVHHYTGQTWTVHIRGQSLSARTDCTQAAVSASQVSLAARRAVRRHGGPSQGGGHDRHLTGRTIMARRGRRG